MSKVKSRQESTPKYPTTATESKPARAIPDAKPSNPSIRFMALAMPTIRKVANPIPSHAGMLTDPRPKN